jgi:hypothetical protein
MTQPSPASSSIAPNTVTITVQSAAPIPTPASCESTPCPNQGECSDKCSPKCVKQCQPTCSHIQKVLLHRKDRETLAEISKSVSTVATRLETLTDLSTNIQAVATSLQNQPSDSTIQESHISALVQSTRQIASAIDRHSNHQAAQKATLNEIQDALQLINASLNKLQNSQEIRAVSSSLGTISTTLKNLTWPLLGIAFSIFLLPFIFRSLNPSPHKIINSAPTQTVTPTPTPIVIPVPSPVYTPIPIVIPVPSPTHTPISLWRVHCLPGYDCLRLRKSPHLSAPVVKRLPCNASEIQITGASVERDGEIWVPIQYQISEGKTVVGWVVRRFLVV